MTYELSASIDFLYSDIRASTEASILLYSEEPTTSILKEHTGVRGFLAELFIVANVRVAKFDPAIDSKDGVTVSDVTFHKGK